MNTPSTNVTFNPSGKFFRRGVDHVGWLGTKLRDLRGFATLAYELIQNADDAKDTHAILFDVRDDALIVDNDGIFTRCDDLGAPECTWKTLGTKTHRCDFHRFRILAGGDKRNEEGTTGAFGIGFVAVYQVTDHPELISNGEHWILDELKSEDQRIESCGGCSRCRGTLPGTRFYLPWARDPESPLRAGLRIESVTQENIEQFLATLLDQVSASLLFLKHLNAIRISRDGELVREIQREKDGDQVVIMDGDETRLWYLAHGNFADDAAKLRERYKNKIEDKRKADVVIAIPKTAIDAGLLYAVLPTEFKTGFPFHINADFFPNSERKGIIFETDYQSAWNRAALRGAGVAIQKMLRQLPQRIGHTRFWELVDAVYSAKTKAVKNQVESSLGEIWDTIEDDLAELPLAHTTTDEWRKPRDTFRLPQAHEEAIMALEALQIPVVDPEVREFVFRMPKQVGFETLDLAHLIQALVKRGFTKKIERSELPPILRDAQGLELLWQEIERLGHNNKSLRDELVNCSIALGRDGALYPCNRIFYAKDPQTISLFERMNLGIVFLADVGEKGKILYDLCEKFTAGDAAVVLAQLSPQKIKQLAANGEFSASELLGWFEDRRTESLRSGVRERIVELPIFPTGDSFAPLTELALTGNFTDPLGFATLVDLEKSGSRRDFMQALGAQELTFQRYAHEFIPRAFESNQALSAEKKRAVVRLLAEQLGALRDHREIREALSRLPLVECGDKQFRNASEVYFPSSEIRALVRTDAHFAAVQAQASEALRDLYSWLGVASAPRWNDLQTSVTLLSRSPLSDENVGYSQRLFEHLTQRAKSEAIPPAFRQTQWLPARGDHSRWYVPRELHATFQDYLFVSQARFLDFPRNVQNDAADKLLPMLGIATTPTPAQVVDHLLYCAERNESVNLQVYTYLNQNDQNAEAQRGKEREIERLQGERCLALENGEYVRPDQVFWGGHSFGRFRHTLGPELQHYANLFELLNVRRDPTYEDAKSVIFDIAREFAGSKTPLDDDAYHVTMNCWQMLWEAFDQHRIGERYFEEFENAATIPNSIHLLSLPKDLLFEDKTGVAALFGDVIRSRIIPRPLGIWRVWDMAGVRSLREKVDSELAESPDARADVDVLPRIARRRLQLARVIEAQKPKDQEPLGILDNLQVFRVNELKVYWTIRTAKGLEQSEVVSVPAHFKLTDNTLYYVVTGSTPPWYDLARELALALLPEVDPGTLAPGVKEVLAPDSDGEVATNLDKLGVAPLVASEIVAPDSTNVVTALGGLTTPDGENFVPPPTPFVPPSGLPDSERHPSEDGQGDGQVPPSTTGNGDGIPPQGVGVGDGKSNGKQAKPKQRSVGPQSRLRTYVEPPDAPPSENELKPETIQKRGEVADAGVEFVLECERKAGREPTKMPPNHPGYDVESRAENGELVRVIEVKSLEGAWGKMGVRLTKNEFDTAREKGELFWLYVVEFATDDPILHRIPNPARLANEFIFDNGWMALDQDKSVLALELFDSAYPEL